MAGADCTTDIDECESHPCQNGGLCLESSVHGPVATGFYQCECADGWSGYDCDSFSDPCDGAPCRNQGICARTFTGHSCTCASGFAGGACQFNVHECDSNPCTNGGQCIDQDDAYICSCPPGFDGDQCETDVIAAREHCGEVHPYPCANGGACHTRFGEVRCQCEIGWTGDSCEQTTSAGWGKTVDAMDVYRVDGSYALTDRAVFASDPGGGNPGLTEHYAGRDRIIEEGTGTYVYSTPAEFLESLAAAASIPATSGLFASDIWVAAVRQHTFTARPSPRVYGVSKVEFRSRADVFTTATPLHLDFQRALDALPTGTLPVAPGGATAEAYQDLITEYGTHVVLKEVFGGRLMQEFAVDAVDYAAHNLTVRREAQSFFAARAGRSLPVRDDTFSTAAACALRFFLRKGGPPLNRGACAA